MSGRAGPGTWIWVPDADAVWKRVELAEAAGAGGELRVRAVSGGEVTTLKSDTPFHACNDAHQLEETEDLTQLVHLHEPAVLQALEVRFRHDRIYTFTGPILLAVNPFKTIRGMYENEIILDFLQTTVASTGAGSRVPHIFSIGSQAFRGLCTTRNSQTILISGESGAGKTESTKFVMRLLALAGSRNTKSQIEKQVLQSNPVLEALGNAKTLRNDNSSRFGKFIEMQYELADGLSAEDGSAGTLVGARIQTYLLESVRVCNQADGERNFHCFYQVIKTAEEFGPKYNFPQKLDNAGSASATTFDLSSYCSPIAPKEFAYVSQSSCKTLQHIDDVKCGEETILAMQIIGIPAEDIQAMLDTLAVVLHLGEIQFVDSASGDGGVVSKGRDSLQEVCRLMKCTPSDLEKALTHRTLEMRGEQISVELKTRECVDSRDALARAIYGTMFLKLVRATNTSIGYRDDVKLFCGILDIFGFECFQTNSFEQLCINFTNERLQLFFNTFIFKLEQQLYEQEQIAWSALDFPDNQDCVDLLAAKGGVFSFLDEECIVPGGKDLTFCNKVKDRFASHARFGVIKQKPEWFIINHFAGPVSYCSTNFLEKNKDTLSADLQRCVSNCKNPYMRSYFTDFLVRGSADVSAASGPATRKKQITVSSEFCAQLDRLMASIGETDPHFVRCLKPNPRNVSDEFNRPSVVEQLRYGGVLQAVQVSRAGYPVRMPHAEAVKHYKLLCDRDVQKQLQTVDSNPMAQARTLLAHLETKYNIPKATAGGVSACNVGLTLVFFKFVSYEILGVAKAELRTKAATTIQSIYRGLLQRRRYMAVLKVAVHVQASARRFIYQARYLRARLACIQIQAAFRGYEVRLAEMTRCRNESAAAARIQRTWRMHRAQKMLQRRRKAVVSVQAHWRGKMARAQASALAAAKAASRLAAAADEERAARSAAAEEEARLAETRVPAVVKGSETVPQLIRAVQNTQQPATDPQAAASPQGPPHGVPQSPLPPPIAQSSPSKVSPPSIHFVRTFRQPKSAKRRATHRESLLLSTLSEEEISSARPVYSNAAGDLYVTQVLPPCASEDTVTATAVGASGTRAAYPLAVGYCSGAVAVVPLPKTISETALWDELFNFSESTNSNGCSSLGIWKVDSGHEGAEGKHRGGPIVALRYSPRENLLLSIAANDRVTIWNAQDGKLLQQFQARGGFSSAAWLPLRPSTFLTASRCSPHVALMEAVFGGTQKKTVSSKIKPFGFNASGTFCLMAPLTETALTEGSATKSDVRLKVVRATDDLELVAEVDLPRQRGSVLCAQFLSLRGKEMILVITSDSRAGLYDATSYRLEEHWTLPSLPTAEAIVEATARMFFTDKNATQLHILDLAAPRIKTPISVDVPRKTRFSYEKQQRIVSMTATNDVLVTGEENGRILAWRWRETERC